MKKTNLAWAAGFIDGEGSFGLQRQKGRSSRLLYLQAGQTDRAVLDQLASILGVGKVYGPYRLKKTKARPNSKPYWYYRLTSTEKTKVAAEMLWPYLSEVKKNQFNGASIRLVTEPALKADEL